MKRVIILGVSLCLYSGLAHAAGGAAVITEAERHVAATLPDPHAATFRNARVHAMDGASVVCGEMAEHNPPADGVYKKFGYVQGQDDPVIFSGRPVPPLSLFGFTFDDTEVVVAAVPFQSFEKLWYPALLALAAGAYFARGVLRGRPGRALNAVRDHRIAAGVMGVPVARYRAGVFVLSSMYAGLAGVLLALVFQRTVPEYFGMVLSLEYLAMIVIGGLGSVAGAVVGAAFVSLLPQVLTHYSDSLPLVSAPGTGGVAPGEASRYLYGAAVVAVVLFLPGGLTRPKKPGENR